MHRLVALRARAWARACALVSALAVAACGEVISPNVARLGALSFQALAGAQISQVRVEISGSDIAVPIVANLVFGTDSVVRQELTVPVGNTRLLRVSAFDSLGVRTHATDTTIAVVAGVNPPVTISLDALRGTISVTVGVLAPRVLIAGPASDSLSIGQTLRLTATPINADGTPGDTALLRWGSSDPSVLEWRAGDWMALRSGSASITASYRGATASRWFHVRQPAP